MRRQRLAWAALLGAPTALELWAVATDRDHWTLSPQMRWVFRCGTRSGNAFTAVVVGSSAAWLAHHLQNVPPPKETQ